MITVTLRQKNGTKTSFQLDKKSLAMFRKAWRTARQGVGTSLVVLDAQGKEIVKISVDDVQYAYHEMIQIAS